MIVIDSHMHSKYSFDSTAEPRDMIEAAISKGIQCMVFTEHLDIDPTNARHDFLAHFARYFDQMSKLREKYRDKIDIVIGLEAGFGDYNHIIAAITEQLPFEYIISSVHVHYGIDYFWDDTYLKREKHELFSEYLDLVFQSLSAPYKIDALGHLGYPSRIVKYADNGLYLADHAASIDKILTKIIEDEVILEINSSVYKSIHPFLPSEEIILRYLELGGKYITFSSDAHTTASLGRNYDSVIARLKSLGVSHLTKSKRGIKQLLPI